MSLFNLRIRGRLYGGFGALVVFGIALAGFAVWQLNEIRTQVSLLTLQSTNAIRVEEIASEIHAIRRALLRYAYDHQEAAKAEADRRLAAIGGAIDLAVKSMDSTERRALFKEVENDIEELKRKYATFVDTVNQMVAGRDVLYAEGDKMAADLQKLVDAARNTEFASATRSVESKVSSDQGYELAIPGHTGSERCCHFQGRRRQDPAADLGT
jgi:chromosome segregation ATPase